MLRIKSYVRTILNGPFDISTDEGRYLERKRKILLTGLTGSIAKVLAIGIPLFTVRISYSYLGEELYGLWAATLSFFTIFHFADLGLGSGMKTHLSFAYGKKDDKTVKEVISSTYFFLIFIAVLIMIIFLLTNRFISWASFFNAESNQAIFFASSVVTAVVVSKIIKIPISLIQRTQMAFQEGYKINTWLSVGYILNLIAIYLVYALDLGVLALVWTSALMIVIIYFINTIVYFTFDKGVYRPSVKYVKVSVLKNIIGKGLLFFCLSILTTLGLALDNFIVARTLGLAEAAVYAILFKMTYMISSITTMFSAPLWSANGDALANNEFEWIKSNTMKSSIYLVSLSLLMGVSLIIIANPLIRFWLGHELVFSNILLIGLVFMQVLISAATSYFMVLNAMGKVKVQIGIFALFTPLAFGVKYYLSYHYGSLVIPWTSSLLYLIVVLIPIIVASHRAIKEKTSRIF